MPIALSLAVLQTPRLAASKIERYEIDTTPARWPVVPLGFNPCLPPSQNEKRNLKVTCGDALLRLSQPVPHHSDFDSLDEGKTALSLG